ncbi:MAG TPA: alanine racemase [Nocardioidaceae bacterium]|nr:alanine racemase [Nocardioidaceae bacterium]
MALTLTVDGPRWRAHLRSVADRTPGLVPVAKGNGYGFGVGRLARKAGWLGSDLLAVGGYGELSEVMGRFDGDVLVMTPRRVSSTGDSERVPTDPRLVHTVGRPEDLQALTATVDRPRVLVEGLTSMRRHGLTMDELAHLVAHPPSGVRIEGLALHLPIGIDATQEVRDWLALGLTRQVFVSHLSAGQLADLRTRHPDVTIRPRVGTSLWLGDRAALTVSATVLDVHAVTRGQRAGYRQRRVPRDGHLLVVAGGTAHGIGLEAPTAAASARQRAIALARGGLDAAGLALSPYSWAGRQRWFLEPPHMQSSMLFLPASVPPPAIGAELGVEARFTTTAFDQVTIS